MPNPIYRHRDYPRDQDSADVPYGPLTSHPLGFTRAEFQQLLLRIKESKLTASASLAYNWWIDLPDEDRVEGSASGADEGEATVEAFAPGSPPNENGALPAALSGVHDPWTCGFTSGELIVSIAIGASFVKAEGLYWPAISATLSFEVDAEVSAALTADISVDYTGSDGEIPLTWSIFGKTIETMAGYGGGSFFSGIEDVTATAVFLFEPLTYWEYEGTYSPTTGNRI